ncbi:acyltransferase family protein [Ideonella sp. B508-1]|uniref:acyltransferase family protein n=1 Tax=Ideonella sp. B508-1 TaxID=137716 RepID=UPI0003463565|nr:acyltransferase family protein [Ideonella sp. B508-1]
MTALRRQDIEWLRVLACLGIVWYHARGPGEEFALSGLIVFVMLSVVLAHPRDGTLRDRLQARAQRLLLPWVFWWGVYALLEVVTGRAGQWTVAEWPVLLLAGPSIHLWYLPFTFFVLLAMDIWHRSVPGPAPAWAGLLGVFAATALLLLAAQRVLMPASLEYPFAQYLQVLPAVLLGLSLRCWNTQPPWARWLSLAGVLPGLWGLVNHPVRGTSWPYLIGFPLGLLLLRPGTQYKVPWSATPLSRATLGIYLVHPLVLMSAAKLGFLVRKPVVILLVFLMAWAAVSGVHRLLPNLARRVM